MFLIAGTVFSIKSIEVCARLCLWDRRGIFIARFQNFLEVVHALINRFSGNLLSVRSQFPATDWRMEFSRGCTRVEAFTTLRNRKSGGSSVAK